MSRYNDKNRGKKELLYGVLSSILLHILILTPLFWLISKREPPTQKIERRVLNLSKLKTHEQNPPSKQEPEIAKKEPKIVKKVAPKREAKMEQKKAAPKQKSSSDAVIPKGRSETNRTAETPTQKATQSQLLMALNAKFKNLKKEAGGPIKKLYGEEFEKLGTEEQKFIKDNLWEIGRITERYLRYPEIAGRLGQEGTTVVEFYLYPNGDISDVRLLSSSGYQMLDKNSIETIELAYKDYPRPTVKTKIRMFVGYRIY